MAPRANLAILRRTDGIAALEFALLAPLMIYTICVAFDIASATVITRRLTNAADAIAELVSQQTDSQGNLIGTETNNFLIGDFFSVIGTFPNVLSDAASKGDEPWQYDVGVIASEVEFGPQAAPGNCDVPPGPQLILAAVAPPVCTTASVIWSAGFTAHQQQYKNLGWTGTQGSTRQCGNAILAETVKSASSPELTTMPKYLYQPGDIIVVDILYTYTPMFTRWFTGSFTYQRSAYITPRFYSKISYTSPSGQSPGGGSGVLTFTDTTTGISSCILKG